MIESKGTRERQISSALEEKALSWIVRSMMFKNVILNLNSLPS